MTKSIRHVLTASVLAVVLCTTMLIGATFAWFTSSSSVGVNTIQTGTLKVQIVDADGNEIQNAISFDAAENWQPGATYTTEGFAVKNAGNLKLKYEIILTGIEGDADLLDVIIFDVVDADGKTVALKTYASALEEGATSELLYIRAHVSEDAGNEYQNLTITGLGITVKAEQYNKYTEILTSGKEITSGTHVISTGVTLKATDTKGPALYVTGEDTNVTIVGGLFDGGEGGDYSSVKASNGANVTIKGGEFTVGADANGKGNAVIFATDGATITIEGGVFKTENLYNQYNWTLNCKDNTGAKIVVKGGTFYKFNPADCSYTGPVGSEPESVIADGYHVVQNGDWYTVVAD